MQQDADGISHAGARPFGGTGQDAPGGAWPGYAPGTQIPVDAWFHQDVRQRLQSPRKHERLVAERDAFIAQNFAAWRIYPVKVGRWRLKSFGLVEPDSGWGDDPISAVLFVLYLIYLLFWVIGWILLGFGRWVEVPSVVQILDPVTGRPIAEHLIVGRGGSPATMPDVASTGTLAFLGDPRVCGLVGEPTPQGTVQVRGTAFRRGKGWLAKSKDFRPPVIAATAQRLTATPYREYPTRRTGPWLVDSPQAPSGGRTRWTRLGRPKG